MSLSFPAMCHGMRNIFCPNRSRMDNRRSKRSTGGDVNVLPL